MARIIIWLWYLQIITLWAFWWIALKLLTLNVCVLRFWNTAPFCTSTDKWDTILTCIVLPQLICCSARVYVSYENVLKMCLNDLSVDFHQQNLVYDMTTTWSYNEHRLSLIVLPRVIHMDNNNNDDDERQSNEYSNSLT